MFFEPPLRRLITQRGFVMARKNNKSSVFELLHLEHFAAPRTAHDLRTELQRADRLWSHSTEKPSRAFLTSTLTIRQQCAQFMTKALISIGKGAKLNSHPFAPPTLFVATKIRLLSPELVRLIAEMATDWRLTLLYALSLKTTPLHCVTDILQHTCGAGLCHGKYHSITRCCYIQKAGDTFCPQLCTMDTAYRKDVFGDRFGYIETHGKKAVRLRLLAYFHIDMLGARCGTQGYNNMLCEKLSGLASNSTVYLSLQQRLAERVEDKHAEMLRRQQRQRESCFVSYRHALANRPPYFSTRVLLGQIVEVHFDSYSFAHAETLNEMLDNCFKVGRKRHALCIVMSSLDRRTCLMRGISKAWLADNVPPAYAHKYGTPDGHALRSELVQRCRKTPSEQPMTLTAKAHGDHYVFFVSAWDTGTRTVFMTHKRVEVSFLSMQPQRFTRILA